MSNRVFHQRLLRLYSAGLNHKRKMSDPGIRSAYDVLPQTEDAGADSMILLGSRTLLVRDVVVMVKEPPSRADMRFSVACRGSIPDQRRPSILARTSLLQLSIAFAVRCRTFCLTAGQIYRRVAA